VKKSKLKAPQKHKQHQVNSTNKLNAL